MHRCARAAVEREAERRAEPTHARLAARARPSPPVTGLWLSALARSHPHRGATSASRSALSPLGAAARDCVGPVRAKRAHSLTLARTVLLALSLSLSLSRSIASAPISRNPHCTRSLLTPLDLHAHLDPALSRSGPPPLAEPLVGAPDALPHVLRDGEALGVGRVRVGVEVQGGDEGWAGGRGRGGGGEGGGGGGELPDVGRVDRRDGGEGFELRRSKR